MSFSLGQISRAENPNGRGTLIIAFNIPPWRARGRPDRYYYIRRCGVCLDFRVWGRTPPEPTGT